MKRLAMLIAPLMWMGLNAPGQAHDALVPHDHPHGVSAFMGMETLVLMVIALAAASTAYLLLRRR